MVSEFAERGFSEAFRAADSSLIEAGRAELELALETDGPDARSRLQSRHLDVDAVRNLCLLPPILDRVHDILGSDVVLWRSNLFLKEPAAELFDWHRDRDHWGSLLTPMINVTAWLALDDATLENGCVELRPHDAEPSAAPIAMEMRKGECFLFDQDLVHRSGANRSTHERLGLAIRFTLPHVKVDKTRLFPSYRTIVLSRP